MTDLGENKETWQAAAEAVATQERTRIVGLLRDFQREIVGHGFNAPGTWDHQRFAHNKVEEFITTLESEGEE